MTRKERQEVRAERYREYADNADKRATAAFNASSAAVEHIPLGQPILVGHHSERAHRRALERSNSSMMQEQMKGANKIVRAKSMSDVDKIDALVHLGISRPKANKMGGSQIIFPGYMLTNNNAKINAAKKQLAKAEALTSKEDREYTIDDITIEECYSENRVRIYFPGKPGEETRTKMKRGGFHWSKTLGCWQCYINRRSLDLIKEITSQTNKPDNNGI